jgi:cysteine-rich repeat protein
MRHGSIRPGIAGLALAWALIAAPASAQFDLTGGWQVNVDGNSYLFDFVQTGTTVTASQQGLSWEGTIAPATGVFSIHLSDMSIAQVMSCAIIDGTMSSADHFTGTNSNAALECSGPPHLPMCQCGTFSGSFPVDGVRFGLCGNGTIDSGEQCDDGNVTDGDCCSSTCTFESAGTPCPDAEDCTYDVCDGAGACSHGPFPGCRTASQGAGISLRDKGAEGGLVHWKWKDATGQTSFADFGTPTVGTGYHLCLFANGALLFGGDAPQGSAWHAQNAGFTYKNADSAPDGIAALKLHTSGPKTKFLAKGKGPLVTFTGPLDVPSVRAQLVRDTGTLCWEATFDSPKLSTPTRFVARE